MHQYIDQLNEAQREPVLQKNQTNDNYRWCWLWKNKGSYHSYRLFNASRN